MRTGVNALTVVRAIIGEEIAHIHLNPDEIGTTRNRVGGTIKVQMRDQQKDDKFSQTGHVPQGAREQPVDTWK